MKRSFFVICIGLSLAGTALAKPPPPALQAEFQAGVDAYRLGHLDEARKHLEAARALDASLPGPHRFLAAVARGQERWQDCITEARRALELNPQSSEAPETRAIHAACRAAAGRTPYAGPPLGDGAAIAVTANVEGATVKIGGLVYGGTPLSPRPIPAGPLDIDVSKVGWQPAHASANALPGIVTDVAVTLEAVPVAPVVPPPAPAAAPTVGVLVLPPDLAEARALAIDGRDVALAARTELPPGTHVIELRAPGREPWRRRVRITAGTATHVAPHLADAAPRARRAHLGLGLVAGGGALLAAGFVGALVSEHAAAEARDIARIETARDPGQPLSVTGAVEPVRSRADFEAARARAGRWAIISDVAYGAGLAAAGAGAVYLYLGRREPHDALPPFAVIPLSGGAMVAKEVSW